MNKMKLTKKLLDVNDKIIMPFGKFKGTPIAELPTPYLKWLIRNCDLFGIVKVEIYKIMDEYLAKHPEYRKVDKATDMEGKLNEIMGRKKVIRE